MSLVAKAFVMDEVSRKVFVWKPIGEFHDLMYGTISSPKTLLYSSESIRKSIWASKPRSFIILELWVTSIWLTPHSRVAATNVGKRAQEFQGGCRQARREN